MTVVRPRSLLSRPCPCLFSHKSPRAAVRGGELALLGEFNRELRQHHRSRVGPIDQSKALPSGLEGCGS
jgi:hypothetical protein